MNLNKVCESVDSLRTNLKNRNVVVDISNITDTLDDVASCLKLLNTLVDYTMYIFISIDGGSSSASFGVDDIDEVVFKNKESLQNYIDKHKED